MDRKGVWSFACVILSMVTQSRVLWWNWYICPILQKYHAVSDGSGKAKFQRIAYGDYSVTATFLGYIPSCRRIRLNAHFLSPDTIRMQPDVQLLDEVVISTPALRSTQNGDTLSYHADAYKVVLGANSESLLTKMPGISVSERGVEAHGRTVQKIMIDGEEFFR